ncbi:type II toxin-antitoxin system RelE/ParE family toxin [Novosphingobium sp. JCM 18896]|uniref:type II toxin-antitoxin system RelE/ParE family toxin n=1 Tax=Novosphingobium sp. JCM 18896 TaxID=2989731 RepID=UPI0022216924|nr:type II toxin-antitoxin system RelE/ParE family toxin [Novosphingobium sp. JCM 18896]MCW1429731.1 type II toxin-antitoxin system RelE/ParE family toxin [Novosphingobium sp. JCM 18896]
MRLIWRPEARQDVRSIFAYISERDANAAYGLLERIEACAERLSEHPFMYRSGRSESTREAVVHPNYIIVYRVDADADAVEILNVMHTRREYPPTEPE